MNIKIFPTEDKANEAAADCLAPWLTSPGTRNIMVAGGNTPLDLYQSIAVLGLSLGHLNVFALDEYVGVPLDEPRNCANLLRQRVAQAWRIPAKQFFPVSASVSAALASGKTQERLLEEKGGLDVIVLGLGQNGHLGFNEPGSLPDTTARVLDLDSISIAANREWFAGDFAPHQGVTVGLKTIIAARRALVLAYGDHKASAVKAMVEGPVNERCPASFLQMHSETHLFLDQAAAARLNPGIAQTHGFRVPGCRAAPTD